MQSCHWEEEKKYDFCFPGTRRWINIFNGKCLSTFSEWNMFVQIIKRNQGRCFVEEMQKFSFHQIYQLRWVVCQFPIPRLTYDVRLLCVCHQTVIDCHNGSPRIAHTCSDCHQQMNELSCGKFDALISILVSREIVKWTARHWLALSNTDRRKTFSK